MSHVDPALVDVRTRADHPLVSSGETSRLRMVATGLGHRRPVRPRRVPRGPALVDA